ncbi:MAG: Rid family hydrolase [Nanoarchaeota archaeon]
MINMKTNNLGIISSSFGIGDSNDEYFISITPSSNIHFEETLETICTKYEETMKKDGLSGKTQIFCRLYLSDIANQKNILLSSRLFSIVRLSAYSIVEQCPLYGGKAALLCYHIKNTMIKKTVSSLDDQIWKNSAEITGKNYNMLYVSNYSEAYPFDSEEQTKEIFLSYNSFLKKHDCSLLKNSLRTWIYVRDIDNHYQGMVKARKDFFKKEGLIPETRYIASTGIEGKSKETSTLVSMDALAISNIDPKQIVRMEARDHLNPTHEYGVTFERGTRIDFGDRSHLYISGTASIDMYGHTIYERDIKKQTERTIENIEALLRNQKSNLTDLVYIIIYLRNSTDHKTVKDILKEKKLDQIPQIMVEGAVCRPEWLVEIEGVAIIQSSSPWPSFV